MKKVFSILLLVTFALSSCGTSNSVSNNRLIQKRKYNKGFHFKFRNHQKDKSSTDNSSYIADRKIDNESTIESPSVNKTETRFVNEDIRENKPNADQLGSTKNESYETAENSRSSSTSVENDINTDFRKSSKRERTNEESSRKKEQLNTATLIVIGSIIIGAAVMYFSGTYFVLLLIPLLLLVIMGIIYLVLSAKFRKAEVAEEDAEQQNKVKRKNKLVWLTIGFVAALFGFLFLTVLLFALSGIIGILGIIGFLATIVGYVFLVRKIKSNESSQAL